MHAPVACSTCIWEGRIDPSGSADSRAKRPVLTSPTFIALAFANLSCLSGFSAYFLFPLFVAEHGGDQVDIGIVMGAFALASVLCRPWISNMIDRIGRKRSYTIGSLIMTLLPLGYLLFSGDLRTFYAPLVALRIIHGVGFAICITAAFTLVADLVPPERLNEGLGLFGVSGLVGSAVGPLIAELIIRRYGFDALFHATAGMGLLSLAAHLPVHETYVHVLKVTQTPFFKVLKKGRVLTVALVSFLFGFGLAAVNGFVSPYATEKQIVFISLYYISYSSAAVLTRLFGGRPADRFGEDRIIPYALLVMATGLFALIFLEGEGILFASGFMAGCGHGFLYPSLNAMAIRNQPVNERGKITGMFTGSIDGGAFVGSVMLGFIGVLAGFEALFFASGLALLAGLGIFRFAGPNRAPARRDA